MTTAPKARADEPEDRRSRLDPEPMPRRDFLGIASLASAAAALGAASVGMLRLPKAAVLPSPSRRFRVALPESLAPGQPYLAPGRPVALFRDEGGVWAISMVCTHLGCIVKTAAQGFDCPCHGSRFEVNGAVSRGPAPKALPWLAVTLEKDGQVLVDEDSSVPAGTKVSA